MSNEPSLDLFFKLSRAERLQLVEDLWDSVVQEDSELSVSAKKLTELRRRKERFLQHPSSSRTWEQVKQRARSQHD
jgi:putative addiction module component (TIGR02574 family)